MMLLLNRRPKFINVLVLLLLIALRLDAQNICSTDKIFIQINPVNKVIFRFQCTSGNIPNPTIPIQGSNSVEFNELDLSPNLYTIVPLSQVCQFANLYLLDLSYNAINNATGVFAKLACLTQLTQLDLSHNLISTPLVASDFNDDIAAHLQSLNLAYNLIPSIDSAVFYKSDGTARFPNLSFLSLANNLLYAIDLLWPMTMSNANLRIELNQNRIVTLVNPLELNYAVNTFIPMTGNRYVDLRNNSIKNFTDSNLLQYGLQSADDFRSFLFKISNYDLRGMQFSCICPPTTGLYTVYWFSQFAKATLNSYALIYQLSCANTNVYIFNFTCKFIGTTAVPTTVVTTNSITTVQQQQQQQTTVNQTTVNPTTANTENVTQTTVVANSVKFLLGDTSTSTTSSGTGTITTKSQSMLGLLALIVIPVLVVLILSFMFLCGRCCLTCLFDSCSINLCLCFRPDGSSTSKPYEAAVCYNEFDENWLEQRFLPFFEDLCASGGSREKRTSRVAKLKRLGGETTTALNETDINTMRSSKRIILIVTKKFLEEEWKNKAFRDKLTEINRTDAYCSIIVVNLSEVDTGQIKRIAREIELGSEAKPSLPARLKYKIANHVKYNCGVRDVEYLDWHESQFWTKLAYLMPRARPSGSEKLPTRTSGKSQQPILKHGGRTVRGKTDSPEPIIDKMEKTEDTSAGSGGDVKVEGRSEESSTSTGGGGDNVLITKLKRINDAKRVAPVTRQQDLITDMTPKEDRDFWRSLIVTRSDLKYEPVGLAGSAVSGNRESNLNRFGLPIAVIDKEIYNPAPHPYPYPRRIMSTTDESVKTVTSSSASSSMKNSRKSVRSTATNNLLANSNEDPTPIYERILIPPEFIPKSIEPRTEELEIRETVSGKRDVRKKNKPSKPKAEEEENEKTTKKPDIYDELLEQVFEETEIKKPRKILTTIDSSRKPWITEKKDAKFDEDDIIKKPKKKVVISNDIRKYNLSSPDEQIQDDDILDELDEYMGTAKKKKSSKKKGAAKNKGEKKSSSPESTLKKKVVASSKKDDDDFTFDFEID